MFDGGVPEQIQRFIASPPPPPPLPATGERSLPFPVSFNTNHQLHHMLNHKINTHHDIKDGVATSEWMDHHPWCTDEVLALLKFRSTLDNWFPEFTWEHTSRKLAEVGFKRNPQECKEKFEEEERRYFNSNNSNEHMISFHNNKGTHRIFGEAEEFYHGHDDDEHVSSEVGDNQNKRNNSIEDKRDEDESRVSKEDKIKSKVGNVEEDAKSSSSSPSLRKRKKERFGMWKGFCKRLVRSMLAQQEEMHKKILEDMAKKEEEKMEREEAWKKQEIERLNQEIEIRAREQAMASERNTNIIKFISKFTDHEHDHDDDRDKVQSQGNGDFQTLNPLHNPLSSLQSNEKSSKTLRTKAQNPKAPKSDDVGKRWPRDEVLALINIRCSISNMNDDDDDDRKEGMMPSSASKAVPLWERISKKMLEKGYKRSAKRCKEKWENINKYFRKTKDVNKKRPLDSRTCPYFHQLKALYTQPSTTQDLDTPAPMHLNVHDPAQKSNLEFSGFDLDF